VAGLLDVKQQKGETWIKYLTRFNIAMLKVDDPNKKNRENFSEGLLVATFFYSLVLRRPWNIEEICARVEKHIEMEEDAGETREVE